MCYQINHSYMAAALAEDVYAPELRNPRTSGMSRNRKSITERIVSILNRLHGQKR